MTGRTHDLAAFTALNIAFVAYPQESMSLATVVTAVGANMIGGLLPDIDDATADIWDKVRFGSLLGRIIKPLIGGHRMISHSFIGMALVGYILKQFLPILGTVLLVDMNIVWWALMIGYLSHLITDSMTTQGVPWFFPLPVRIGFPPVKWLRIKTGTWMEFVLAYPVLLGINGYIFYVNYPLYLSFIRNYIK